MPNRKLYSLRLNETPSLEDHVYEKRVPRGVTFSIAPYREMIGWHWERRLTALFYTLVMAQGTHATFSIGTTHLQAESAPALYREEEGTGQLVEVMPRHACHSATIPCLKALGFDVEETTYERFQNTTLAMPSCINKADSELDGRTGTRRLRDKALAIIQRASDGELSIIEGMQAFLKVLDEQLKSESATPFVSEVWKMFRDELSQIRLTPDSPLYDRWLDLPPKKPSPLRDTLHQIRVQSIRTNIAAEASLMRQLRGAKSELLKKMGARRKPDYFDSMFQGMLLARLSPPDRSCLSFLLSNPRNLTGADVPKPTNLAKTRSALEVYESDFERYAQEVEKRLKEFRAGDEALRKQTQKRLGPKHLSERLLDRLHPAYFYTAID